VRCTKFRNKLPS